VDGMTKKERVEMLKKNLSRSKAKLDDGIITLEYYRTLEKDVIKRIKELKNNK
jgi:hypothetical protein